jgi:hypothetical protein
MPDIPPTPEADAPSEPLLKVGALTTVATAAIALAVAYNLPVTEGQRAAIIGFVGAFAPLVVAVIARRTVWSPASVRKAILAAGEKRTAGRLPTTTTADVRDVEPGPNVS